MKNSQIEIKIMKLGYRFLWCMKGETLYFKVVNNRVRFVAVSYIFDRVFVYSKNYDIRDWLE